eukprot:CAMPEP_0171698364 /NCGR_PEP_ID=MMETSP0991-20121206/9320_1 /TAXON_ID=483369 /ORGANISM="non described non described, Strain CCMP2098" /LENGTH=131 /DNA_ID=CAMNT_0012287229 /DNA_START=1 /DNA_END=393 /DNA_ORIENTATION=-
MTGPYTPTQFLPWELQELNVPLNLYDRHWEIRGSHNFGGRSRALTKRDHADGCVRAGVHSLLGPEFQSRKKSIAKDLPATLGEPNSGSSGAVPMCIFSMVVDHPSGFFDEECRNGISSIWRESLAQVANLA